MFIENTSTQKDSTTEDEPLSSPIATKTTSRTLLSNRKTILSNRQTTVAPLSAKSRLGNKNKNGGAGDVITRTINISDTTESDDVSNSRHSDVIDVLDSPQQEVVAKQSKKRRLLTSRGGQQIGQQGGQQEGKVKRREPKLQLYRPPGAQKSEVAAGPERASIRRPGALKKYLYTCSVVISTYRCITHTLSP